MNVIFAKKKPCSIFTEEPAVADYVRQPSGGYPSNWNNGHGGPYNRVDYNNVGYVQDYNNGRLNGNNYNRPAQYQDARYQQDYYQQGTWPYGAPMPYREHFKPGEKYYDNLASRKHDRSLLENLNNFPVQKN
ncbi:hypothetical protein FQA39_LY12162 [Lamprigera yunnana]|nr:hypothetical protein FQA39_LY12162 [Lamprigera yunnana]